jgi:hypothetical protein
MEVIQSVTMPGDTQQEKQRLVARGIAITVVALAGVFVIFFLQPSPHSKPSTSSSDEEESRSLRGSFIDTIVKETRIIGEEVVEAIIHPGLKKVATDGSGESDYYLHEQISATLFWIGEKADDDNADIPNRRSAWDDSWEQHYGGVDDPEKRDTEYSPSDFTPKENPYYFALPYNDFDEDGERKQEALALVPWGGERTWGARESMLKNRWIKIIKGGRTAYAQWEDVGPFEEDDAAYVFGEAEPKSRENRYAGLDLSPAVNGYLGLDGIDEVDWQFIEEPDVPDGPWKEIITRSQITWK